ncbi:TPA: capsular polysaccharide synthesis protein [Streptococcus pneumoniae]|nr:capsular polysaccharide synthesis protein [Streptococcus pneumoniae]
MIEKILDSIKNHSFYSKLKDKIHRIIPLYIIKNQNIAFQQDTDIAYRKLKKKFRHISLTGDELKYKMEFSNKVWICWFQGEEHAPELIKTCIQSMRNQLQGREIIVLTEKNISDCTEIPGYIIEKYKKGWISRAHYSDILRIDLLCRHGGLWVDATVLNTGGDFSNLEVPLFVYKSLNLSRKDSQAIVASSWLISSYSNHPILLYTRKLLWAYWRRKNSLCNYFLFHICFTIATERYPIEWSAVPTFNNHSPHILHFELNEQFSEKRWEQLKHISAFHKLNHHIDYSSGVNTFYKFIVSSKV